MTNLSHKVVDQIKDKHLAPKPKWHFLMKNVLFWCAFLISVIIGMIAFSAFLYRVVSNDWDIYRQLGRGPVPHFFMTLPYVWILVILLFTLLAIYNFRHTKGWYRHKPVIIVTASVLISIVGGTVMFTVGYGDEIDRQFMRPPTAGIFHGQHIEMWQHPEIGLLAGEVLEMNIQPEQLIILRDYGDKEWNIKYVGPPLPLPITAGDEIKALGEVTGANDFAAFQIRPARMGPLWKMQGNRTLVK